MKHLLYYLSFIAIISLGFSLLFFVNGQKQLQMSIIVLTAFFYVVLGVFHHFIHHSFSLNVMLEYIAIAIFGIAAFFFIFRVGL